MIGFENDRINLILDFLKSNLRQVQLNQIQAFVFRELNQFGSQEKLSYKLLY